MGLLIKWLSVIWLAPARGILSSTTQALPHTIDTALQRRNMSAHHALTQIVSSVAAVSWMWSGASSSFKLKDIESMCMRAHHNVVTTCPCRSQTCLLPPQLDGLQSYMSLEMRSYYSLCLFRQAWYTPSWGWAIKAPSPGPRYTFYGSNGPCSHWTALSTKRCSLNPHKTALDC